jgi:DNA helicase-2/ATP-dependent DNA helicase PcrA
VDECDQVKIFNFSYLKLVEGKNNMWNKAQLEFINAPKDGRYSVISVAGSGKSTIIIERLKKLTQEHKIMQHKILATSFTKTAENNLSKKLNKIGLKEINVSTIHSLAFKIVIANKGENYAKKLIPNYKIRAILYDLFKTTRQPDKDFNEVAILNSIGIQQAYEINYDEKYIMTDDVELEEELLRFYYSGYELEKQKADLYDFSDYIKMAIEIMEGEERKKTLNRRFLFEQILADEFQDSSNQQTHLLECCSKNGNISLIGDFQQAIYSFNGGNQNNLTQYHKKHSNVKIINMSDNYRSDKNIVNICNNLTQQYYGNYDIYKPTQCNSEYNGIVKIKQFEEDIHEAEFVIEKIKKDLENGVTPTEIAILFRNNRHGALVEGLLKKEKIDYTISGSTSIFNYKEIKTIGAILRLFNSEFEEDIAMADLANLRAVMPFKYLPKTDLERIINYSKSQRVSMVSSFKKNNYMKNSNHKQVNDFINKMENIFIDHRNDCTCKNYLEDIVNILKIKEAIEKSEEDTREVKKIALDIIMNKCSNMTIEEAIVFLDEGGDVNKKKRGFGKKKKAGVRLTTIHSAKGEQFDICYFIQAQAIGNQEEYNSSDVNIMYVALSRPKHELYISYVGESALLGVIL